jgi:hypothetical protein
MALACRDTNILNHTIFDQFHHVQAGQLLNLPSQLHITAFVCQGKQQDLDLFTRDMF